MRINFHLIHTHPINVILIIQLIDIINVTLCKYNYYYINYYIIHNKYKIFSE